MRNLIYILTLSILTGCFFDAKTSNAKAQKKTETIYTKAGKDSLLKMITNPCDTFSYEIEGFYSVLDTLPEANEDTLFADNYLKDQGFLVISSGWGNWEKGPRIFTLELSKGSCNCRGYKKYYYKDTLQNGKYNLRVTEKIVCNADNNAVE